MSLFARILRKKGLITTLLALIVTFPTNIYAVLAFCYGWPLAELQLALGLGLNIVGWIFYTMPSKLEITGKLFGLKMED
ncbi:hypothetical protein P0082_01040 [Candidatus Haliotispira prima]|uniref:Uncharacterized protein n=1 Tax=Candidatus Haliotispira prima TaxID=3034016 RepID=A0ABY8MKZ2_9SPIO|nr:hypothetical protein P0082_01040 [Candidatus Haliotispira prima]